jgi:hypothetical protein
MPFASISLIGLTIVPDPARGVTPLWIGMRPVNHAPFRVPFILAIKGNRVPRAKRVDTLCQIDVVGHKNGSPGIQSNNEALMPAAMGVVG